MTIGTLIKEDAYSLPQKIYIEPTSACNLACTMCFRHKWIDEKIGNMSSVVFSNVYNYIKKHSPKTVFFGGMGEPLIHSDIINMVKAVSPFAQNTELITNGTSLSPSLSAQLIQNGLTRLWVSMDGFCEEQYEKIRLGGQFKEIISNLKEFNRLRKNTSVGLGVTFVIMEDNINQLKLINSFADEYGADLINLSHAVPLNEDKDARSFYNKKLPLGKMHRLTDDFDEKPWDCCPFIEEQTCFVKWDGEVVPCMQLLHSSETFMFDVKRKVYSHSFGNIKNTPLYEIYTSKPYREFRNNVLNFDFPACVLCDGCDMRKSNEEDCMFNTKPTCGACLWATGKVFCP